MFKITNKSKQAMPIMISFEKMLNGKPTHVSKTHHLRKGGEAESSSRTKVMNNLEKKQLIKVEFLNKTSKEQKVQKAPANKSPNNMEKAKAEKNSNPKSNDKSKK